ncbi:PadR family transcriptional regulator [Candidatus Chloroploca sp. Khr17]|uniref:PadR family transcriptional regulator n=1 Tax=Candidatus Chloroploca sp. Khr17 TaxID=2496869 RepID=UPI001F0E08AC|nr:PadR family transcriptional regulator [Candidatus Chloroploca sp. Khr17]
MEERLLILGLLRSHEMHGYQLHDVLADRAITAVHLSKANAYKLLNKLAEEGLIEASEEREGNRPARRVYRVTLAGEAAFQAMLRQLLAAYIEPEFPSIAPMNFIGELPPAEALELLHRRRTQLGERITQLANIPEADRVAHLSVDFFFHVYRVEQAWLDRMIERITREVAQ